MLDIKAPVQDIGTKSLSDVTSPDGKWALSLQNVGFQYSDGTPVLKDVFFEAHSSETIAIVAASGGGKSMVAKLMQRFWDVDTGVACVNGTDIRNLALEALREIVTVIPQETYLFHGSIRDNLKLAQPQAIDQEIE